MGKGFSFLNAAAIPAANTATTASAAAAPAASSLRVTPAVWSPSCNEVGQCSRENGDVVASPLQLDQDWFKGKGDTGSSASFTSDADAATHLLSYWLHRRETSNRSVVAR